MKDVSNLITDLVNKYLKTTEGAEAEHSPSLSLLIYTCHTDEGQLKLEFDFSNDDEQLKDLTLTEGVIYFHDEEYKIHPVDLEGFVIPDCILDKLHDHYFNDVFSMSEYQNAMRDDWNENI